MAMENKTFNTVLEVLRHCDQSVFSFSLSICKDNNTDISDITLKEKILKMWAHIEPTQNWHRLMVLVGHQRNLAQTEQTGEMRK